MEPLRSSHSTFTVRSITASLICIMVSVEEVKEEEIAPSQHRLLDAEEIESVAKTVIRTSVKIHLESLATKLRRESEALKRVETSKQIADVTDSVESVQESPMASEQAPVKRADPPTVSSSTGNAKYGMIDQFSFDAGGYDAPFVTLYVSLPGVGSIPRENVSCNFKSTSFDLTIKDLKGKSYRLLKDNLEKDIDPQKSKIIVKAEKIVVKLAKVKQGDYGGYDYWSQLTSKKGKNPPGKKDDPQNSIMQMMKDMYDDGDDNMKKIIGEAFSKQQRGEMASGVGGMGDSGDGLGDI